MIYVRDLSHALHCYDTLGRAWLTRRLTEPGSSDEANLAICHFLSVTHSLLWQRSVAEVTVADVNLALQRLCGTEEGLPLLVQYTN